MNENIKKSIQGGLGVYAKTRKEIESAVSELMKKNAITKKEGKKMIARIFVQSKKIEKQAETQVRRSLLSAVKTLKVITEKELSFLEKKLKRAKRK